MGISAVPLLAPKAVTRPEVSARFSVLIPTWNNLPYLGLCVESIRRNSAFPHQVVVHVSDGSDDSLDRVRSEGIEHTWSRHNAGVSLALKSRLPATGPASSRTPARPPTVVGASP